MEDAIEDGESDGLDATRAQTMLQYKKDQLAEVRARLALIASSNFPEMCITHPNIESCLLGAGANSSPYLADLTSLC